MSTVESVEITELWLLALVGLKMDTYHLDSIRSCRLHKGSGSRLCHMPVKPRTQQVSGMRFATHRLASATVLLPLKTTPSSRRIRDDYIMIEVCLSSNVALGHVADLESHPARLFFDLGIPISFNTDDPPMLRTSI